MGFLGDGEMDEPESMGALTMPVREELDNLIFVINCNLQRLDGPVRGNGKIIQELEAAFLGAGWNVLKVFWGSRWDALLARDNQGAAAPGDGGMRRRRIPELQSQGRRLHPRALLREVTRSSRRWSPTCRDEGRWRLDRGGHDPRKVYAAYAAAMAHKGQPTVILAKTVKGFGLGKGGEGPDGRASAEEAVERDDLRAFRDRFHIPVSDEEIARASYRQPSGGLPRRSRYLHEHRKALGWLSSRRAASRAPPLAVPPLEAFSAVLEGTGEREISPLPAIDSP